LKNLPFIKAHFRDYETFLAAHSQMFLICQTGQNFTTMYSVLALFFFLTQLRDLLMSIPTKRLGIGTEFLSPPPAMLAACRKAAVV
jgi:hypothetical protein